MSAERPGSRGQVPFVQSIVRAVSAKVADPWRVSDIGEKGTACRRYSGDFRSWTFFPPLFISYQNSEGPKDRAK
jgi:hypothetical protein